MLNRGLSSERRRTTICFPPRITTASWGAPTTSARLPALYDRRGYTDNSLRTTPSWCSKSFSERATHGALDANVPRSIRNAI